MIEFPPYKAMPNSTLKHLARSLSLVSRVAEFGCIKRDEDVHTPGWPDAKGMDPEHMLNKAMRHWLKIETEKIDPESSLPHLAHMAWDVLAALELTLRSEGLNPEHIIEGITDAGDITQEG